MKNISPGRLPPYLIEIVSLVVFFAVALYLRVGLPHGDVFSGGWIKFTTPDAYYFMRQVDSMVVNFPHHIFFDPYINYPGGASYTAPNLFVFLLSAIIWVIGLGSPSQHLVNVVGVYYPAVLAALTVIPVFFIGKALFNRWGGIIAAGLIAILPGEFLGRTILGAADRDALEVLLTATTMLFVILAIKSARDKGLTFKRLLQPEGLNWPFAFSLLAGIALGLFLLTWRGAFLIVIIILAYFIVQSIIDRLRRQSSDYLGFVCGVTFLVAVIMFLPVSPSNLYSIALGGSLLAVVVLSGLSWWLERARWKPVYYPAAMAGIAAVGLGLFFAVSPSVFKSVWGLFGVFVPSRTMETVSEVEPILFPGGHFSLAVVWGNYTFGAFLSLIALCILIYLMVKRRNYDNLPLIVWSVAILIGTLELRRLAVLFAVNVALLMAYLGWEMLRFFGLREAAAAPVQPAKAEKPVRTRKKKGKQAKAAGFRLTSRMLSLSVAAVIIFLVGFLPNFFYVGDAVVVAKSPSFTPTNGWHQALDWLKNNTPEPFGSADYYYAMYPRNLTIPATAYSVAAWWDYGYWISRIGQRRPSDDPGGGARQQVAQLFTAQDEAAADGIANSLNSKYIVLDEDTFTQKFGGVMTYAGLSEPLYDIYYQNLNGTLRPVIYYYPEFYQSFSVRLYYFDGQAVTPKSTTVISYEDRVSQEGIHYRVVLGSQSFSTYSDAQAYMAKQTGGNYRIVGTSPADSPLPLTALDHYKLDYSSDPGLELVGSTMTMVGPVKVFEYTGK